jgi:hypothetical protein
MSHDVRFYFVRQGECEGQAPSPRWNIRSELGLSVPGGRRSLSLPVAVLAEFLVALAQEIGGGEGLQLLQVLGHFLAQGHGGGGVVVMGAADGLGDDAIDEVKLFQIRCRDFHQ